MKFALYFFILFISQSLLAFQPKEKVITFYNSPNSVKKLYPEGTIQRGFKIKHSEVPRALPYDENNPDKLILDPTPFEALVSYEYEDGEVEFKHYPLKDQALNLNQWLRTVPYSSREQKIAKEVEKFSSTLARVNESGVVADCGLKKFDNNSVSFLGDDKFHFKTLPSHLANFFRNNKAAATQKISEELMEEMLDQMKYSVTLGEASLAASVDREIYTTVDKDGKRFFWIADRIDFDASLSSSKIMELLRELKLPYVTPYVNASGRAEIVTVRMVEAKDLEDIPSIKDIQETILSRRKKVFETPLTAEEARLNSPLGLVTQIGDVPLSAKKAKSLPNNFTVSYGVGTELTTGVSYNFGDQSIPFTSSGIHVNYGVFTGNKRRIIFNKVSEEDAKDHFVRLTYRIEDPSGVRFNANTGMKIELFKYGPLKIGKNFNLVSVSDNTLVVGSIEQSFLFNLDTVKGSEAYEAAAKGNFSLAQQFSEESGGEVVMQGIEHSYLEKHDMHAKLEPVPYLLKLESSSGTSLESIQIVDEYKKSEFKDFINTTKNTDELTENTQYVGRSYASKSLKTPFQSEAVAHEIETTFRADEHKQISPMTLTIKGEIRDNKTKSSEHYMYKETLDQMVGADATPLAPYYQPVTNFNRRMNLGRSEYRYQMELSEEQIKKILDLSPEEFWQHLEFAFNREPGEWTEEMTGTKHYKDMIGGYLFKIIKSPLALLQLKTKYGENYLEALKFFEQWSEAKNAQGPREQQKKLSKLFNKPKFSNEVFKLLRTTLDGESFPFSLWGDVKSLGNFDKKGWGTFRKDITPTLSSQKGTVKEVSLESIDQKPSLTFESPVKPQFLHVIVSQSSGGFWFGSSRNFTLNANDFEFKDGKVMVKFKDKKVQKYFETNRDIKLEIYPNWDGVYWDKPTKITYEK
jgi:hypothetical protein